GIKCKSGWTGLTYAYTDDAPDECFRSYSSDLQSYTDHSDFLRANPRYKSLFSLDPSDYKAWASGLKKCGYATNPAYAQKLIQTIETFGLQQYTQEAAILRSDATYLAYASPEDHPNSLNTGSDANPLLRQAANEFPDSGPGSLSPDLALQDGDKDEMPV